MARYSALATVRYAVQFLHANVKGLTMKIHASVLKTARVAYLYADGHAVIINEEKHARAGTVEYATVYENIGIACHFAGRIIIHHRAAIAMLAHVKTARARMPTLQGGSENTRKAGQPCGYVGFCFGQGMVYFYDMPGLIGSEFTYQETNTDAFNPEAVRWSDYAIARTYREQKAA